MDRVPQKELRNNVGEVLRRAEAGETLEVTVSGRPVALLTPLEKPTFIPAEKLREIFRSPSDPNWMNDIRQFESGLADPFEIFE